MDTNLVLGFVKGFGLGGSLIIAIGAQNAYVLRQGLKRKHVGAVATVCFACDVILIAVGVAGFGRIVSAFPLLTAAAAWGGAAFLFVYGLLALRSAFKPGTLVANDGDAEGPSLRAAAGTALALSLLNPHVYLDTVVLIGSIAAQYESTVRTAFGVGAAMASFVWFYGLGCGAARLAPIFRRPVAWRLLDVAIAIVMWSIAIGLVAGQLE